MPKPHSIRVVLLPSILSPLRRKWTALCLVFFLSAFIVLLGASLLNGSLASQITTPLDQVRIEASTVVGREGFFRVGKSTQGRWWLIAPEGKPFFYRGVTSVNFRYPDRYVPVVTEKYGKDPDTFRDKALGRMRSWNFNALGAWTAPELWDWEIPYTVLLDFGKVNSVIKSDGVFVPDVFDPKWLEEIDAKAKDVVAPRLNSKLLVGYFTDNELDWASGKTPDQPINPEWLLTSEVKPSLLQFSLSLEEGRPAYAAAWDFVLKRHGNSLQQLAKDWQVAIDSKDTVKQWTKAKQAIASQGYLADAEDFSQEFARRYFELSAAAIRRYDQNHLILGCRFASPPGAAVLSATKRPWVDVVSANNYRYTMYERMNIYYEATQLPILNSEFSWGHKVFSERPLPEEPQGGLSPELRMIRNGEQSLARALTHPGLVGYTWYRWVDLPDYTPPISNGLVNLQDEPNRLHTDLLTKLNAKAEAIATSLDY